MSVFFWAARFWHACLLDFVAAALLGVGIFCLERELTTRINIECQKKLTSKKVKAAVILAFAVNCWTVQIPGRLDGQVAEAMTNGTMPAEPGSEASARLLPATGVSYITPAGWAFTIWAPIFLGEMLFCVIMPGVQLTRAMGPVGETVEAFLPYWVSANLYQSMWCYAFRPFFHTKPAKKVLGPFVSAIFLGMTAWSLGKVNMVLAKKSSSLSTVQQLMFVPMTMHFGWTTAATLVNVNGAIANYAVPGNANLYRVACVSIIVALTISVVIGLRRCNKTYPFVIAWALFAVADGMSARIRTSTDVNIVAHARTVQMLSSLAGIAATLVGVAVLAFAIGSRCRRPSRSGEAAVEKNVKHAAGPEGKQTGSFLIEGS
jgi:hypothetical protein